MHSSTRETTPASNYTPSTAAAVNPPTTTTPPDQTTAPTFATLPNANKDSASQLANSPVLDESTTNGFTTAPGTSEEDNLDHESDDDVDDDEDDSRSNFSNKNSSNISMLTNSSNNNNKTGKQYGSSGRYSIAKGEETKRSHHNVLERKRRDLLKDSFWELRNSVPTFPKERVSRAEILKQAANFIQITVQKNATVQAELDELIRKNQELEERKGADRLVSAASASGQASEQIMKQEH